MSELKTNLEQILQEKTTKLIPENIKRKVEIFDITGTDGDAEVEELRAKIIETRQEIADTRRDLENSAATVTGTGENVTLNQTAEATLKKLGVGGNTKQAQYTGKNLAKVSGSASVNLFGSISVSKDSNDIIINGTATGDIAAQKAFVLDGDIHGNYAAYITPSNTMSLTAGTYVLTVNNITGSYSGVGAFWIRFVKKNESQPHTAIASLTLPSTSVSFNIEVDGEYFISPNFSYTSETNVTFNNYKFNIMLASGTDITYEPYVGGQASPNPSYPQEITNVTGDVEVVVGNKNLIDINNPMFRNTILRQWGSAIGVSNVSDVSQYIKVIPNTQYTLSLETADSNYRRICFYKQLLLREEEQEDNTRFINYTEYLGNTKTFATPNECNYIRVAYLNSASKVQLEKSSTATEYVEHKGQTFTFPLGNEKLMLGDYLANDGIHHVRRQGVLDGTEAWFLSGYSDDTYLCTYSGKFEGYIKYDSRSLLCNTFVKGFYTDVNTKECIENSGYTVNLKILKSRLNEGTINGLKTWLAERYSNNIPVIVEYKLNEEVIVPYTSAQQEVYDIMKRAISYEEQTNISSSNTVSPIFTITAFRDADLVITSLDNQLTLKE